MYIYRIYIISICRKISHTELNTMSILNTDVKTSEMDLYNFFFDDNPSLYCHCNREGFQSSLYKYIMSVSTDADNKKSKKGEISIPAWFIIPTCVLVERHTGQFVQWGRLCECLQSEVMEILQSSITTELQIDIYTPVNLNVPNVQYNLSMILKATRQTKNHQWNPTMQFITTNYNTNVTPSVDGCSTNTLNNECRNWLNCKIHVQTGEFHCCALQPSKRDIDTNKCVCSYFIKPPIACQQCFAYNTDFMNPICQQDGICRVCNKNMFDTSDPPDYRCACYNMKRFVHFMYQYKQRYVCTCDILHKNNQIRHYCNVCKINSIIETHVDQCNKECCFYPLLAMHRFRRSMICHHPCPPIHETKYNQELLATLFHQTNHHELLNSNIVQWRMLHKSSNEFRTIQSLMPPGRVLYVKTILNSKLYKMHNAFTMIHSQYINLEHSKKRALWHGTTLESANNISKIGFNRNCTKVCQYGKGVYFSVNSNYSLQDRYSPSKNNIKCMVIGLLTIGDCYEGTPNQDCLPEMQTNKGMYQKTFDTLVDNVNPPSIVVSMMDHHAYPAYKVLVI